jgi:hypothetical protein
MMRAPIRATLLLLALLASGCAAIPIALDATIGGVSIYQRYQDRQVQRAQNEEIRLLREEIKRLREALTE